MKSQNGTNGGKQISSSLIILRNEGLGKGWGPLALTRGANCVQSHLMYTRLVMSPGPSMTKSKRDMGVLYWCEKGRRSEVLEQRLELRKVTDIYRGCDQPAFQNPASLACLPDKNKCFSLVCSDGRRLDLQAASSKQRDAWVWGVKGIINLAGKKCKLHKLDSS